MNAKEVVAAIRRALDSGKPVYVYVSGARYSVYSYRLPGVAIAFAYPPEIQRVESIVGHTLPDAIRKGVGLNEIIEACRMGLIVLMSGLGAVRPEPLPSDPIAVAREMVTAARRMVWRGLDLRRLFIASPTALRGVDPIVGIVSSDPSALRLAMRLSRLRRVRRSLASRSPELVRVLEAIGVLKEDSDGYIVADRRLARAIASLAKAIGRYRRAMTSQE